MVDEKIRNIVEMSVCDFFKHLHYFSLYREWMEQLAFFNFYLLKRQKSETFLLCPSTRRVLNLRCSHDKNV